MQPKEFLNTLASSMRANEDNIPETGKAGDGTHFMWKCILGMAESQSNEMHMCARNLPKIDELAIQNAKHMAREFCFDITLYSAENWQDWSLPDVIIEHLTIMTLDRSRNGTSVLQQ